MISLPNKVMVGGCAFKLFHCVQFGDGATCLVAPVNFLRFSIVICRLMLKLRQRFSFSFVSFTNHFPKNQTYIVSIKTC